MSSSSLSESNDHNLDEPLSPVDIHVDHHEHVDIHAHHDFKHHDLHKSEESSSDESGLEDNDHST